jgi:hypothetical protein
MSLFSFPWEDGEKPYWINPDNGFEWYVDKDTTKWCTRETLNDLPKLNAVCFYVVKVTGDVREAVSRVLIDKDTNAMLADETNLEAMAVKIDMLRIANSYTD